MRSLIFAAALLLVAAPAFAGGHHNNDKPSQSDADQADRLVASTNGNIALAQSRGDVKKANRLTNDLPKIEAYAASVHAACGC